MIEYLSNLYWDDIRYMVSVPLCIIVGYFAGWHEHKKEYAKEKRREELRLAITDMIHTGSGFMKDGKHVSPEDVYLKDV